MKIYELPELPYEYNELEPFISSDTLYYHHDFHHKGYVANLNRLLGKCSDDVQKLSFLDLLTHEDILPGEFATGILNNLGGHINHSMFWEIMCSPLNSKKSKLKTLDVYERIVKDFGSFKNFQNMFTNAANILFGSGWAWLVYNSKSKKLEIASTKGHGNPLSDGKFPILTLDVWEHAYYLDYQNRRSEFVDNFWKLINWKKVNDLYVSYKQTNRKKL